MLTSLTSGLVLEVSFNIIYLLVVWDLVFAMWRRKDRVITVNRQVALSFVRAFTVLALGDSFHLGFRVWVYVYAYIYGSNKNFNLAIEQRWIIFDHKIGLVGLGGLATAVTITFFYMVIFQYDDI